MDNRLYGGEKAITSGMLLGMMAIIPEGIDPNYPGNVPVAKTFEKQI